MTISRSRLVDTTVSRWYHCISRCVRRAHLMGTEAAPGRKDWIENRLKELDQIFAVSVGGFSLMDNHLHLLLRIDPDVAKGWSDTEVVERWFRLFPRRGSDRKPMKVSKEIMDVCVANVSWVAETRKRLSSLGWFMKSVFDVVRVHGANVARGKSSDFKLSRRHLRSVGMHARDMGSSDDEIHRWSAVGSVCVS